MTSKPETMSKTDDAPEGAVPTSERFTYAMRQASLLALALLFAGYVTGRLQPADALDRNLVSTPFLWAIVLWCCVLAFHAVAFERSQMGGLERWPLFGALGVGAVLFFVGLITLDGGSFGRRLVFLFLTSLGIIMFWWAALSLAYLVTQRIQSEDKARSVD